VLVGPRLTSCDERPSDVPSLGAPRTLLDEEYRGVGPPFSGVGKLSRRGFRIPACHKPGRPSAGTEKRRIMPRNGTQIASNDMTWYGQAEPEPELAD
jgi:hypothetical protein